MQTTLPGTSGPRQKGSARAANARARWACVLAVTMSTPAIGCASSAPPPLRVPVTELPNLATGKMVRTLEGGEMVIPAWWRAFLITGHTDAGRWMIPPAVGKGPDAALVVAKDSVEAAKAAGWQEWLPIHVPPTYAFFARNPRAPGDLGDRAFPRVGSRDWVRLELESGRIVEIPTEGVAHIEVTLPTAQEERQASSDKSVSHAVWVVPLVLISAVCVGVLAAVAVSRFQSPGGP